MELVRSDGRACDQLRRIKITKDFIKYAEGSCLIEFGDTKVICTATVDDRVPPFLNGTGQGWLTAEYSMLPRATAQRNVREAARGKLSGRTQEIQRLIGRSLRASLDLSKLGERTIWIDCDVVQADGGTRTASITGGFIALYLALKKLDALDALKGFVSAVSVGIVGGVACLDLNFEEDSSAQIDMNVVMLDAESFVEIQGTAESGTFSKSDLDRLLSLAQKGISEILKIQREVLEV